MTHRFFIFAGETSGDLHGASLLKELKSVYPSAFFEGCGGERMRQTGFSCLIPTENFQVMGFTDVFKAFFRLRKYFYILLEHIKKTKPDLVLLIDYPGFNLRLAKHLKKAGFKGKIVQYICPKVWAWGKHRIHILAKYYDLLLTIFPFEKDLFKETNLHVEYVGHPLSKQIASYSFKKDWKEKLQIPNQPFIALFPGSRPEEIKRNAPILFSAVKKYHQAFPNILFLISFARKDLIPLIQKEMKSSFLDHLPFVFLTPSEYRYEMMQEAFFAVAKSGTVTVELAFFKTPTVVLFVVNKLNKWLVRLFLKLKLPFYCMVNILMKREVFPEFIAKDFTSEEIYQAMTDLHDKEKREKISLFCEEMKRNLSSKENTKTISHLIKELL